MNFYIFDLYISIYYYIIIINTYINTVIFRIVTNRVPRYAMLFLEFSTHQKQIYHSYLRINQPWYTISRLIRGFMWIKKYSKEYKNVNKTIQYSTALHFVSY